MSETSRTLPFVDPESGDPLTEIDGALRSPDGTTYPIERGIPRFVASELYAASFGLEWTVHSRTQLDSVTGTNISRNRLERCLGNEVEAFRDKLVLEPGCGAGRFSELMVGAGAIVHSIDLSVAVEANLKNIGVRPNHVVAQADLMKPPFPAESFDLVMCLGVLQHTPSVADALRSLWRMVRPGGMLVFDHYAWSLSRITQLDPIYRLMLRPLGPERGKGVTDALTRLFFPAHWAVRKQPLLQALLSRVSPLYTYMHAYPDLSKEQHYEWARLDAFDHLFDRYKRLTTPGAMSRKLAGLEPASMEVWRGGNGVEARLIKAG